MDHHPYRQFDEEPDFAPAVVAPKSSAIVNTKLNAVMNQDHHHSTSSSVGGGGGGMDTGRRSSASSGTLGNKVRLRAIESESEYFLKLMNVTVLRWLILIQAISAGIIFLSQILLYSYASKSYYKPVDYTGIGIWGPIFFFSVASGLTWLATKSPSGCCIGSAMGFQITSSILATLLLLFSIISLVMHGRYSYHDTSYDPETGRVFCSFMILGAGAIIITGVFTSVHFCRTICCGRQRTVESIMFDVEAVK